MIPSDAILSKNEKEAVRDFWDKASCGEDLLLPGDRAEDYAAQAAERYRLEPFIAEFAGFADSKGETVLEIGVGLGADQQEFHKAGAIASGIDLTPRAIEHCRRRLELSGYVPRLQVADAENLPFDTGTFDRVYSWGVLHHTPDTSRAIAEAARVLKPGGQFRAMIYNKYSIVGFMLWLRYAVMAGRPTTGLDAIYSRYMESPGTKAFTPKEAKRLVEPYLDNISVEIALTHGDLLESGAGQRHQGRLLDLARKIWPRPLLRKFARNRGLFLMISGTRK